jgi:hypothetical protein
MLAVFPARAKPEVRGEVEVTIRFPSSLPLGDVITTRPGPSGRWYKETTELRKQAMTGSSSFRERDIKEVLDRLATCSGR